MFKVKSIHNNFLDLLNKKIISLKLISSVYCPLCGKTKTKIIYRYKDMCIYKCFFCYMMFQDSSKVVSEDPMYKKFYDEALLEYRIKLEEKRIQQISSYLKCNFKGLKVLEIGTGTGVLASLIIDQGAEYRGLETSEFFLKQILNNFPYLYNNVKNCILTNANFEKNYFDLILIIDTLEHIPFPAVFLEQLKTYLKNNGRIYIEVPNESLLIFKGYIRKILGLYNSYPTHPEHVNLFTMKTLKKTLNLAGFFPTLSQMTILGNFERMKIILGVRRHDLARLISNFFSLAKLDIIFQQGNIRAFATKAHCL